ncbi:hypothetical protein KXV85_000461, partial [Aspergillus fumigatus]
MPPARSAAPRSGVPTSWLAHPITHAAHGFDGIAGKTLVQLGTQTAHMGFDNLGLGIEMEVPDPLKQHGPRHESAALAHQLFQQAEFARLQQDGPPIAPHLPCAQIQRDAAAGQAGPALAGRHPP